jgi:putative peptidoglycan lipid II flippase
VNVNRKIFHSALVIGAVMVFVKCAAALRDLITAAYFGTSPAVDSFFLALTIPAIFINVLGASFGAAATPLYLKKKEQAPPPASVNFISSCLSLLLLILTVGTLLLGAIFIVYFRLKHPGTLSKEAFLTRNLILILLPTIIFGGLSTFICTILNAEERFALPAASALSVHVLGALGIFLCHDTWGVYALACGILAGSILQTIMLVRQLASAGLISSLRPALDSTTHREIRIGYVPVALGTLLMGSAPLIDQVMASWLGPGEVAILGYGNKIAGFFLDIGSLALGTAIFPYLARMSASNETKNLRHTIRVYARLIIVVTLPLAIVLSLASVPLVRLIFERGSFSASDTARVARIQSILSLQIPFYALGILFTRVLPAIGANQYILWATCFNVILNVTLNYLLMSCMGLEGIALSTVFVYAFSATFTGYFSYKNLKSPEPTT